MTPRSTSALPFSPPLALAPLDGVATPPVLAAWAAVGGMGLLCAPFVRVSASADPPWSQRKLVALAQRRGPMVHSVQLLGTVPERVAAAARAAEALGVDIIDLNFGCPSRVIVRKGAGAGMLGDPEGLAAVVRAVRAAVALPISAKIRLGLERPEDVLELVPRLVDAGADLLAVHARTLADGYHAPARWEWLARVVAASPVPVIGNGDVWTARDALRLRAETGCAAVMVGRGALRNPWIFHQILALDEGRPEPRPRQGDLHAFLQPLAAAVFADAGDPHRGMGRVKELVAHLGRLLADDGAWRRGALRETAPEALLERIAALGHEPDAPLAWDVPRALV